MARYDLRQLSSRDFEELVRDLLQAEWNVSLEAFRTGRDQGIDLRRVSANGGATIHAEWEMKMARVARSRFRWYQRQNRLRFEGVNKGFAIAAMDNVAVLTCEN